MAKKKKANTEAEIESPREYAKCDLSLPSDSKVKVNGLKGVGVDDTVRLIITGTVREVSDSAEEWNRGKRMTVKIKKCRLTGAAKETSIDDALKDSLTKV